ncbi:MAG: sel1 repeat family protein [Clostridiaceae bacterium]|jgi:TPR repeat protein|nr:sel1 repeat family protein [Clostridiaceae bacterium]
MKQIFIILFLVLFSTLAYATFETFDQLLEKANAGDVSAQVSLAGRYAHGRGVPQNYKEAAKWYRMAAEQGHTEAQYYLGVMYYDGKGVKADYVEAYKWISLAGMNGKNVDRLKSLLQNLMTTAQITEAQLLVENYIARGGEQ